MEIRPLVKPFLAARENVGRLLEEIVERVRAASDIVEVVSGYLNLRRKGRNWFGLCPFHHEKTPSFSVNEELQIFHCFGCGAGGNVFTFIMRMEGVTFIEAVKLLAGRAGIPLPEDEENLEEYRTREALYFANRLAADYFAAALRSESGAEARRYLQSRGIEESEYDLFGIGYAPNSWDGLLTHAAAQSVKPELLFKAGLVVRKENGGYYDRFRGRITFAVRDLTGQVVAFGARRLAEDNSPKYINSPETDIYQKRLVLYGLYNSRDAIRQADEVVIVEGYTDLTSLYRVNIRNVVATSGTALTEDHARLLRRYTANAVLFFDSDSAGSAAALRGADILLENGMEVKIAAVPEGKDPDEFARRAGEQAVRRLLRDALPLIEFKLKRFELSASLGSSSQKAEMTRELIGSVAKIADPIRRSFVIRDLAERLHIDEVFLRAEAAKWEHRTNERVMAASAGSELKTPETRRASAEIGLLEVAVCRPEVIPMILVNLNLDDIADPEIRAVFDRFAHQKVDPTTFRPQEVLASIQDPSVAARLSALMQQKEPFPKYREFTRDCLINLHMALIDEKIRRLKERMQSEPATAETLDELRYHLKQREKIRSGEHLVIPKDESSA